MKVFRRMLSFSCCAIFVCPLFYGLASSNVYDGGPHDRDHVSLLILSELRQVQEVKGDFRQEKIMPLLKKPLLSYGSFHSIKGKGLLWEVREPIASTTVLLPGVLKQITGNDIQEVRAKGTEYDGLGILLPALLDGDLKRLSEHFIVEGNKENTSWTLSIKPKSQKLAGLLKSVTAKGEAGRIIGIKMVGASDDVTNISFNSVKLSNVQPAHVPAFLTP